MLRAWLPTTPAHLVPQDQCINGKIPRRQMDHQRDYNVPSLSLKRAHLDYIVSRSHNKYGAVHSYFCSCPPWEYSTAHPGARTCKHLSKFLGEDFDIMRMHRATFAIYTAARADVFSEVARHTNNPSYTPDPAVAVRFQVAVAEYELWREKAAPVIAAHEAEMQAAILAVAHDD
ncbi:hypothetical protein FB45DRAFT_915879 [Roridomyces roridus]|uniref:SWIM-type domain-containing protein n=1 Tax=Roridomyces roridus TaxID=1738132 RepID=A0AAD7BTN6_9AGAR|nr:hypothetical protein FB45DRAFT_915879 [Roridomyces roridus]